ncbi:N-acetylated-alpha-linked acidic dipeptidase 2-like isoform X1 [Acanthaster planci]|uniref:N-acetylated-alpha-linked acidic dipeptidase 2-like isoform X1 n=2 Tax=Acanthaster planci TaxID=133434 RepID=A0A8B7YZU4_ACAPL|nr:N-acetylated-alpha-linked acidic dipeptidase 2-like isoform X1 [Acanthaster planci]XP_022098035.1 N-acetylated-alpha-linked acidic dipeptidase 2-like isoform X1 [Acanthaster planci]XP_022098036.1 N-acetylated-alpha-linked acidic dipeptidase 2-like isoform X1 [Acanthaster planci]
MASGDSAIEIMELSHQSPDHIVAESHVEECEPLEGDVFLPATPVTNFARIPARAHSTPRPKGNPTDSDAHLQGSLTPDYTTAPSSRASDHQYSRGDRNTTAGNGETNLKPCDAFTAGRRQFFFCLSLFAMAVLAGFLVGYFVREKVFERESALVHEMTPTETRGMYHQQAIGNISTDRIAEYTSIFSQHQCVSGIPCSQSMSNVMAQQLRDLGFTNVRVSSYNVLTSHPDMSHMSTLQTIDHDGQVLYSETLYGNEKDTGDGRKPSNDAKRAVGSVQYESDSTNNPPTVMYMPFSGSGQVQGELVYVHYASQGDLLLLTESNIDLSGKIAIARQGTMMVADQVRNVEEGGMKGLLLFTDPADMDVIMMMGTERLVGMTGIMGDPLTPGCPAMDGIRRMPMDKAKLPSIPVQPVSTQLAVSLLSNMTGREAPLDWQGGFNVTYHMGRRKTKRPTWTVQLDLSNMQQQQEVHDVVVTITGMQMPDEYIILGGHFASMMSSMGGMTSRTADAGSMSMFMETATVMSQMMSAGWQPQRSVVLGMWGGAEYGHAGSMEWVEEHRSILSERAVSYIDLDTVMAHDSMVVAQTSPLLKGLIMEAADMLELTQVIQPAMLSGVGDHVAFSHMIGIPSVRLYATRGVMKEVSTGSPTTKSMHKSVAQLATQTVLMLADSDMIPFDSGAVAEMLVGYVDSFDSKMGDMLSVSNMTMDNLQVAVSDFMAATAEMQSMMRNPSMMESSITMTMVNHRLMYMERAFVGMDPSGSMTHILYGMTEMDTFPLVAQYAPTNMNNETMATMMEHVSFIQCSVQSATLSLKMDFS